MPGIADGAVLLAKSDGCPRQAYRYGDRVYGFQCHFELTPDLVKEMISHCANDLKPSRYVMSVEQLMTLDYSQINAQMDDVMDYLAGLAQLWGSERAK